MDAHFARALCPKALGSGNVIYTRWNVEDIEGTEKDGLASLITEVNSQGRVVREVGLNSAGHVVHKCPSEKHRNGVYGYFDLAVIAIDSLRNDLSEDEFSSLWSEQ